MHRIPSIAIGPSTRGAGPRGEGGPARPPRRRSPGWASATAVGRREAVGREDRDLARSPRPGRGRARPRSRGPAATAPAAPAAMSAPPPQPVEALEDRPPVDPLDPEAVRVHRRVHGRVEHAQHEVRGGERRPRGGEADRGERDRRADPEGTATREARAGDEHPGEPLSSPPIGKGRYGDPQLRVREAEAVLDRGQAGQHRGGDRAVGEEQRADGDPRGGRCRGIVVQRRRPMVPDCPPRRPARTAAGRVLVTPMPELPEVETVARDPPAPAAAQGASGPGPVITGRRSRGPETLVTGTPRRYRGRHRTADRASVGAASRSSSTCREARFPHRPPQDDRASCSSCRPTLPVDPALARLALGDGTRAAVPRRPQVRQHWRDPVGDGERRARSTSDRPGAARRPSSRSGVPVPLRPRRAGSSRCCSTSRFSPASATSTPTRRCGARGSTRCGPPAACGRPMSAGCTTQSARAGRGDRAARQLDRRLHRARGRRRDAGAPRIYQRTGEPCPRCGRPIRRIVIGARDALLLVVPAAARRPAHGRRTAAHDDSRPAPRRRPRPPLDRADGRGRGDRRATSGPGCRPRRRRPPRAARGAGAVSSSASTASAARSARS